MPLYGHWTQWTAFMPVYISFSPHLSIYLSVLSIFLSLPVSMCLSIYHLGKTQTRVWRVSSGLLLCPLGRLMIAQSAAAVAFMAASAQDAAGSGKAAGCGAATALGQVALQSDNLLSKSSKFKL